MIKVTKVSKYFNESTPKEVKALIDVSLHVEKNQMLLLKGVSGSGKSTLLSLIAGLYQPTFGEIVIDKEPISRLPEQFASRFRRHHLGIIFQKFYLLPTLSVLENVLLPTLPDKVDLEPRAMELLKRFGLEDKKDRLAKDLSGGEQQRVAIARALIHNPPIILADEPTANLDKALSCELMDTLEALHVEGKTIVIATHDPLLLEWKKCEGIIAMDGGKVV